MALATYVFQSNKLEIVKVDLPQTVVVFSQKSGIAYIHELNRKFFPNDGDVVTAYYMDDPEEAFIPERPAFYLIKYAIAFISIILICLWMKRLKKQI